MPTKRKSPIEELRQNALNHYDELSGKCHIWLNTIPNAINHIKSKPKDNGNNIN